MDESARQMALNILLKFDKNGKKYTARELLDLALRSSKLARADKAFVTELVYGSIRWRKKLDWIISRFSKRSLEKIDKISLEILRLGVYQLLLVENMPPYAAVNETVILARQFCHPGIVKFVNALLREIDRQRERIARIGQSYPDSATQPIEHISTLYSFPQWIVERWVNRYGFDEALAICKTSNFLPPLTVRANTLKIDPSELAQKIGDREQGTGNRERRYKVIQSKLVPEGLRFEETLDVTELEEFKRGEIFVQDEASMLISHLVGARPGELVVDVCAAPGGKSTHMAQMMRNRGQVAAIDISKKRLDLIQKNCRRLGIKIVQTILTDARHPIEPLISKVDRVLVDAPCSGFGSLRRKPDIRWSKDESDIESLSKLQLDILNSSCLYLKPGGVLVYSVCSFEPEENERVIHKFLEGHPDFSIENAPDFLPNSARALVSDHRFMRSYPHFHDIDGFFAARMRKKG